MSQAREKELNCGRLKTLSCKFFWVLLLFWILTRALTKGTTGVALLSNGAGRWHMKYRFLILQSKHGSYACICIYIYIVTWLHVLGMPCP